MKKYLLGACAALALCGTARAQTPDEDYQALATAGGALLRAGVVCNGRAVTNAALDLMTGGGNADLIKLINGFPNTVHGWGDTRVRTFNQTVTDKGVGAACAYAKQQAAQEREAARRNALGVPLPN